MRKKYELFVNNYDKIACNVAAAARFFFQAKICQLEIIGGLSIFSQH